MWEMPNKLQQSGILNREKQKNKKTRAIYKKREGERAVEIYYKPWAHVITEAAKSHDLSSASWRPRKASGVIQYKTNAWERALLMVQTPVQVQQQMR